MKFEFDTNKSKSNRQKHGIDFVEGQKLWKDPQYVEIEAKCDDEKRYAIIGKINNKIWIAFITYRTTLTRIISIRRARKEEVKIYESV